MTLKLDGLIWKTIWHLLYSMSSFVHNFKVNSNWIYSLEMNSGQNQQLFVWCDLEIWGMTLKYNRTPFLSYFKLCASFRGSRSIQNRVTDRRRPIRIKIGNFWSCVTFKFDKWPWKTKGHLFYTTSICVSFHNHQSIQTRVTVRKCPIYSQNQRHFFPVWPWKLTNDLEKQ